MALHVRRLSIYTQLNPDVLASELPGGGLSAAAGASDAAGGVGDQRGHPLRLFCLEGVCIKMLLHLLKSKFDPSGRSQRVKAKVKAKVFVEHYCQGYCQDLRHV